MSHKSGSKQSECSIFLSAVSRLKSFYLGGLKTVLIETHYKDLRRLNCLERVAVISFLLLEAPLCRVLWIEHFPVNREGGGLKIKISVRMASALNKWHIRCKTLFPQHTAIEVVIYSESITKAGYISARIIWNFVAFANTWSVDPPLFEVCKEIQWIPFREIVIDPLEVRWQNKVKFNFMTNGLYILSNRLPSKPFRHFWINSTMIGP